MPGTDGSKLSCTDFRQRLREPHESAAAENAHMEDCDACLDAWLDATVTQTLDKKPEVRIPSDFAARVAAQLPAKRKAAVSVRGRERHWGLLTAVLLIAVGMLAMVFADPRGLNSRMGVIFMLIVASEVAAIALWLGTTGRGERRS